MYLQILFLYILIKILGHNLNRILIYNPITIETDYSFSDNFFQSTLLLLFENKLFHIEIIFVT